MRRGREFGQGLGATAPAAATVRAPGAARPGWAGRGAGDTRPAVGGLPGPAPMDRWGRVDPRQPAVTCQSCRSELFRGRLKCPLPESFFAAASV